MAVPLQLVPPQLVPPQLVPPQLVPLQLVAVPLQSGNRSMLMLIHVLLSLQAGAPADGW